MNRAFSFLVIAVGASAGVLSATLWAQSNPPPPTGIIRVSLDAGVVAAPGRVEPRSEEIVLSSEIGGRITRVLVQEGERVESGQVVATLDNSVQQARVAEAEAYVLQKEAELRRVENGAHEQERRAALAAVREAEAIVKNFASELARREHLLKNGFTSDEQFQKLQSAHAAAMARLQAARSRHLQLTSPTREEDVARAEADLALARARLEEARAQLQRTIVRSPIDGTVLRRFRKAGEVVSELRDTSILSVGDVSTLRVRADVDEADIARVTPGAKVYVKADAFGDEKFSGRVVRIGRMVGRKNFLTETPGERVDTKVLEVLVELDRPGPLMPGLRVDVFFEAANIALAPGS